MNDGEDPAALLQQAWALKGVTLESPRWPGTHGARVLRVVGLRDVDPRVLARFSRLEALVLDVVPVTPHLVAALAGLPRLRALALCSDRLPLAASPPGFAQLELLWLPQLDVDLGVLERFLCSLPRLRALRIPDAQQHSVPPVLQRLQLSDLDVTGVPIPEADLAALQQAHPGLRILKSPINLGWAPGIAGVLRVVDGFLVEDLAIVRRWEEGVEMTVGARQVTVTVRWRETPADAPDYQEDIHGPVDVETFIRQGPPIALRPWDRRRWRMHLEKLLQPGVTPRVG